VKDLEGGRDLLQFLFTRRGVCIVYFIVKDKRILHITYYLFRIITEKSLRKTVKYEISSIIRRKKERNTIVSEFPFALT
jgi:hypothetical protein